MKKQNNAAKVAKKGAKICADVISIVVSLGGSITMVGGLAIVGLACVAAAGIAGVGSVCLVLDLIQGQVANLGDFVEYIVDIKDVVADTVPLAAGGCVITASGLLTSGVGIATALAGEKLFGGKAAVDKSR